MKRFFVVLFVAVFAIANVVNAQNSDEGVTSFGAKKDSWKRENRNNDEAIKATLTKIADRISVDGLRVIMDAKKANCFKVSPKSMSYGGQVIDGYAVDGFCGILKGADLDLVRYLLVGNPDSIDFKNQEECVISPKIMIRFSRGFDNTDVMISVPCYSAAVYYAGRERFFNMKPISSELTKLVESLSANTIPIEKLINGNGAEAVKNKISASSKIKRSWAKEDNSSKSGDSNWGGKKNWN